MSKPLGYYDPTMAEGSTPASLIASVKANILACGWQLVREDTSASPFVDLIPPTTLTNRNLSDWLGSIDQVGIACGRGPSTPSPSIYCEWIRRS